MNEIPTWRLYLLRAAYLLIAVGLGAMIWPGIISHTDSLPHMNGVVRSLLGAVGLLSVVGIFYPVRMLPVMFFELVWKVIWLVAFGLRPWLNGSMDAERYSTLGDCVFGVVVVLLVVPWGFVFREYFCGGAEPWRATGIR